MNPSESPLISVALATYNGEKYLAEMLDSIENQDYPHVEIVIADDASTDATPHILRARCGRFPCTVLEDGRRLGVIGNFSRAIAACHGDYIAFADQDDVWRADKLSRLLERMRTIEQARGSDFPALVFSDLALVDERLTPLAASFFTHAKKSTRCAGLADFFVSNHVPGCAMLVNRALIQRAMPVPQAFHMHDWWFIMVAAAFGEIAYIDAPLIQYRQHSANTVGVHQNRHSLRTRLRNACRWESWKRFLLPPADRIQWTRQNIALFENRYRHTLPQHARKTLAALRACARNWWPCVQFLARAKTGESLAFSFFTLRAIAPIDPPAKELVSQE